MAAPIAAQKLKHGKALCKAVFGRFVDTFNWLVDFCSLLNGDRDVNPAGDGRITVDRSDPSAPVIRCSGCGGGNADTITLSEALAHLGEQEMES